MSDGTCDTMCKFVSIYQQKKCNQTRINKYGYCQTHATSVQGYNAMQEYKYAGHKPDTKPAQNEPNPVQPVPSPSSDPSLPKADQTEQTGQTEQTEKTEQTLEDTDQPMATQQDHLVETPAPESPPKKPSNEKVSPEKVSPVEQPAPVPTPLSSTKKKVVLVRNAHGRYEDPQTHIVFDKRDKTAYALQENDGRLRELSKKEIAICNARGWKYALIPQDETEPSTNAMDDVSKSIDDDDSDDFDNSEEDSLPIDQYDGTSESDASFSGSESESDQNPESEVESSDAEDIQGDSEDSEDDSNLEGGDFNSENDSM